MLKKIVFYNLIINFVTLSVCGLELAQLSGATGGVISSGTIMIESGDGARSGGAARRGAAGRGARGEGPAARCAATR